jgi:uncharacterized membrane protein HdeD (DUF308 family)
MHEVADMSDVSTSTTRATTRATAVEDRGFPWWLVLISGIAALVLGSLLLSAPGSTTVVILQFLGVYWLVSGIFSLVSLFVDRTQWGWKLFGGIVGILAGFYILQHPLWSALLVPETAVTIMGILGIMFGMSGIVQSFQTRVWGPAILGVLSILMGLYLLLNPFGATLALPVALGIIGVGGGIVGIVQAFRMRSHGMRSHNA